MPGGLKAPDPNRPFDSKLHLQKTASKPNRASQPPLRQQDSQGDTRSSQPCNTAASHQSKQEQGQSGLQTAPRTSSSNPSSSHVGAAESSDAQQQQPTVARESHRAGHNQGSVRAAKAAQQEHTGATDEIGRRAGSSKADVRQTSCVQQQQQQQQSRLQGSTGKKAGSSTAGITGRLMAPAGPQDRVLAKLGLGRKPSQVLQTSSQTPQASATAAPSGQSHSVFYSTVQVSTVLCKQVTTHTLSESCHSKEMLLRFCNVTDHHRSIP